jgi:HEAT repeat protein
MVHMAQRTALPADVSRHAIALARAMTIALRAWGFYPPEHPAVGMAIDKLLAAAAAACSGGAMPIAVTPHALLVDGIALESTDLAVVECAELLHDRDILQLTIASPPTDARLRALLTVLSLDRQARRARGGPAAIWAAEADGGILLEQIDYQEILEREADAGPARRDTTWKSIVRSIIMGRTTFTAEEQQRLIEISRDLGAIGELCKDTREPYCMPDGSPMITTQAATVLAVYRHIAKAVGALEPQRLQEVVDSLALAAGNLEPNTALEMILQEESHDEGVPVVAGLRKAFDDQQVAMLLARALSSPGHPTGRLARVLDTLAPDEQRKRRVLTLARKLAAERDFGSQRPLDDIRKSLDELLLKYDETDFVSTPYRDSMDEAAARAAELAARGLPPEIDEWLETLGSESVRRLSGQLLIDLLRNETVPGRMTDTARDMGAFVEELLLAGAFAECQPVVDELIAATTRQPAIAPDACRQAVDAIGASTAFAETASSLADQSPEEFAVFEQLARTIGAATVPALLTAYQREDGTNTERATAIIGGLGPSAIPEIAAALEDPRWFVQRELARALGRIGTAGAVAPLQQLLRRADPRVLQAAVAALAGIDDPAAQRALYTVLKAASGQARAAVISALVGMKHPRVVPMLGRVLQDSDPFRGDHPLVLDTLSALAALRDDRVVSQIAMLARKKRWLAWRTTRQLRDGCVRTLARIGSAKARDALADLAKTGDFFLRRQAARAVKGAP